MKFECGYYKKPILLCYVYYLFNMRYLLREFQTNTKTIYHSERLATIFVVLEKDEYFSEIRSCTYYRL